MRRALVVAIALLGGSGCTQTFENSRTAAAVAAQCPLEQTLGSTLNVPTRYEKSLPECTFLFRACEQWVVVQFKVEGATEAPRIVEIIHQHDPVLREPYRPAQRFDLDGRAAGPEPVPIRCEAEARVSFGRVVPVASDRSTR